MKHLGDITKISGHEVPVVDCIIGGSPCQDLSVAGLRKGLSGERSGLFMEQIRIVKEMRERERQDGRPAHLCRPRFMVWENVPGAFSSNKGADFQAVLTEIARIAEPEAPDVPLPDRGGWTKAGCLYAVDGRWSIAWRVHDAQFWGVPQRRKRISLVADFGGLSAPEICFERKGMRRDPEAGGEEGQETAGGAGDGAEGAGGCLNGWDVQSKHIQPESGVAESLYAGECRYGGGESYVMQSLSFQERAGKPGGGKGILIQDEHVGALSTVNNQSVFCLQGNGIDRADTAGCNGRGWCEDVSYTLNTIDRPAVFDGSRRHDYEPFGDVCETVQSHYGTGGGNTPIVLEPIVFNGAQVTSKANQSNPKPGDPCHTLAPDGRNILVEPICVEMTSTKNTVIEDGISPTLTARMGTGGNQVNAVCVDTFSLNAQQEVVPTMRARQYKDPPITYQNTCSPLMASGYAKNGTQEAANDMYVVSAVDCRNGTEDATSGSLQARASNNLNSNNVCRQQNTVRRLTPKECERLQGFPDDWTKIGDWVDSKGKRHKESDGPRYKALGNSIALPFWFWLLRRISAQYERPATMGSLFDGIGGFPLCWERCNGKGTAIWASEIEEFPIAVTKIRFPEGEEK